MLAISLRFVRCPGWTSTAIDRFTGGFFRVGPRWSHVGAMTLDGREFGARSAVDKAFSGKPGVQFRPGDYARFADQAVVEIPVTRGELDEYWRLARVIEGSAYSHRGIVGFFTGYNEPDDPHKLDFICSTAQAWLLLHASAEIIPPAFRGELRQISPNGFYYIARMAAFYRRGLALLPQERTA